MSLDKAYSHTTEELQLDNLKESLKVKFDEVQKSHDAIHEFMLLAPKMFPHKGVSWHTRSAFLLYHLETFDSAHRSLIEALCGYYNVAFVLLRSVLELLLKGAFFECLAHTEFRNNTKVLEKDGNGARLINLLKKVIGEKPEIESQLEKTSATVHDMVMVVIEDPAYRPSVQTLVKQLFTWGLFKPIKDWRREIWKLYGKLSADVHVIPDRTDVGKVLLLKPEDLFKRKTVYPSRLEEYLGFLHEVIDIGIVIELNILKNNLKYDEVGDNLMERLPYLEELELVHSVDRVKSFLRMSVGE